MPAVRATAPAIEKPDIKTCSIKTLPLDTIIHAANTAVTINPNNAPSRHLVAMAAQQGVILPAQHLALMTQKYWGRPGVHLTVGFLDNPPADLRARILSHMNAWGQYCNVSFVESSSNPQVRIARTANDPDPNKNGYWSYLGTDILHIAADQPTMNLEAFTMSTADSEFYRVVRHETGHTLGFPHEHMRTEIVSDIDQQKAFAYFLAADGWDQNTVTAQVLTPLDNSALIKTANADVTSIMCYWLPASIMKDGKAVPGGSNIDALDQQSSASVYPLTPYKAVYAQGDPGHGIGGYDIKSAADRAFAFDYDHSGKLDHLALYRPATGTMWILKNNGGTFSAVYHEGDPGHGIGGYDLKSGADRAFAFDYDHSGKMDHIVLYRPGTGTDRKSVV